MTVFIAHGRFYEMVPALHPILIFFEWHALAVDLFFMLSGFVLVHVYARKFETGVRPLWKPYFAARFARIVPLYLATFAACLGIFVAGSIVLHKWPAHVNWDTVTTNLLLLQGWPGFFQLSLNAPSWSLSVEVFCYIFVMPLALFLDRRPMRGWIVAILIALLVVSRAAMPGADGGWTGLARGIVGFLTGSLLHKFYIPKCGRFTIVATLSAAALFLILQSLVAWGGFASFLPVFTFPFLIHGLARSARTIVHAFFDSRLMLWLGDISYSTYLWQGPIYLATHLVIRPHLLAMPLGVRVLWIVFEFTLVLVVSHLSFHRLELPVRKWLRS